jgi:hypothetical protein
MTAFLQDSPIFFIFLHEEILNEKAVVRCSHILGPAVLLVAAAREFTADQSLLA